MKTEMQTETGTGQSVTNTFLQNSKKKRDPAVNV